MSSLPALQSIWPSARPSALVTGAAKGIGAEIAKKLASRGYLLTLLDLDLEELDATAGALRSELGATVLTRRVDVLDSRALSEAFSDHMEAYGGLTCVVNNAGIPERGDFFSVDDGPAGCRQGTGDGSNWRSVLDVDLAAVIEGTRLAIKAMTTGPAGRGGVIVNVASAGGLFPMPFSPVRHLYDLSREIYPLTHSFIFFFR